MYIPSTTELEYASAAWDPFLKKDISTLEMQSSTVLLTELW